MTESEYQKKFTDKLKKEFPGSKVLKNDSRYIQGIPDWSFYYGPKYAILEIKIEKDAAHQPNQDYYINDFKNQGAFSAFVYPENEKEVLKEMHKHFDK